MKIREITFGTTVAERPVARRFRPRERGLSVIALGPDDPSPDTLARALRDTLASPDRSATREAVPFVRVVAEVEGRELAVADDGGARLRMLNEALPKGPPMTLEIEEAHLPPELLDEAYDTLLGRVAAAAGAKNVEALALALVLADTPAEEAGPASPAAQAFVEAHRRAQRFAAGVRDVDDRMTASVVPDWLWIATGVGGLAVFTTAIAFLYPELRIYLIAALSVLSVVGFTAYGVRAYRELGIRGALQTERAEVRARREEARAEASRLAEALRAGGEDPEVQLAKMEGVEVVASAPCILAGVVPDVGDTLRQIIVLVAGDAANAIQVEDA